MDQNINKRIGILGGGQLGKMLCQAGSKLGLSIAIMERDKTFPAYPICSNWTDGDITKYEDVIAFGKDKDVITIEIENVNLSALEALEEMGKEVYPPTDALKIIKDKGLQKTFYEGLNFPTSDFTLFKSKDEIIKAIENKKLSIPFVQKSRTEGYDGKGVHVVRSEDDLKGLLDTQSVVEDLVDIKTELSVIVARRPNGEMSYFPPVEMEFHPTANLVEFLFSPSMLEHYIQEKAINLAMLVAQKLEIVGLLAVEMFVTKNDEILVNEVAPRPHNSGHHTIEACDISQYEMHLRAILDLPLINATLIRPAVMVNLLGEEGHSGTTLYSGLTEALQTAGVYPHLYGKKETKPYRKMGHVTIVNADIDKAKNIGHHIKNTLKVIAQT
jgi:5-(carboxyamino)imidazole ribonucleotide synthase